MRVKDFKRWRGFLKAKSGDVRHVPAFKSRGGFRFRRLCRAFLNPENRAKRKPQPLRFSNMLP
ncbi:hypothetical protein C1O40_00265 [Akkermansia muciniphila]|nr:hypothetical protein C1O40_00265 [Akkermansia muciniphila]